MRRLSQATALSSTAGEPGALATGGRKCLLGLHLRRARSVSDWRTLELAALPPPVAYAPGSPRSPPVAYAPASPKGGSPGPGAWAVFAKNPLQHGSGPSRLMGRQPMVRPHGAGPCGRAGVSVVAGPFVRRIVEDERADVEVRVAGQVGNVGIV